MQRVMLIGAGAMAAAVLIFLVAGRALVAALVGAGVFVMQFVLALLPLHG